MIDIDALYSLGSAIFAAGGAWAVMKYRVDSVQKDQERHKVAHEQLKTAVQNDRVEIADRLGRIETKLDHVLSNGNLIRIKRDSE
jgi:hypothetical protein